MSANTEVGGFASLAEEREAVEYVHYDSSLTLTSVEAVVTLVVWGLGSLVVLKEYGQHIKKVTGKRWEGSLLAACRKCGISVLDTAGREEAF